MWSLFDGTTRIGRVKGEGGLIASYGFDGIPKFVVIGPDGKILDKWTGYGKGIFEARLKKLCKIYDGENK